MIVAIFSGHKLSVSGGSLPSLAWLLRNQSSGLRENISL